MQKFNRAVRRHHRFSIREARKNYHGDRDWSFDPEQLEVRRSARINTPTPCSCFMCGNERRHWGTSTLQERKHFESLKYD